MFATKVKSPLVILLTIIVAGMLIVKLSGDKSILPEIEKKSFNIHSWTTTNGTKVMYVHAKELPMVDIRVVFDAGSARDADKPGLANMTNLMLDLGAGPWSTDEIAERVDSIGASIGMTATRDMAVVSLRSLTDKPLLDKALDTFAAVLHKPRFPDEDLQRERKQILIALKNQQQSPSNIGDKIFYQALYGKHPYAIASIGKAETVSKLQRADLQAFYNKYYVASNTVIALVGDLDEQQVRVITERISDGLAKGRPAASLPAVSEISKPKTFNRQHPSTQTHIMVGQPGMMRGDEDYFALYVGNHILGGSGFGSRIVAEVREKRGLAYSSYSYFSPMRRKGPFLMGLQTANGSALEALKVLQETLVKFIQDGPTDDELEHAKQNITGGFPLSIDSNKDIVGYLAMLGFYNLPLDYLQNFNNKIMAVSREQITAAFKKRINPDKMITVMVGNLAGAKKAKQ